MGVSSVHTGVLFSILFSIESCGEKYAPTWYDLNNVILQEVLQGQSLSIAQSEVLLD